MIVAWAIPAAAAAVFAALWVRASGLTRRAERVAEALRRERDALAAASAAAESERDSSSPSSAG